MTMPMFDLKDHFDATIPIGDAQLPVRIKRFSRAEMDAFEKRWNALIVPPRGSAELPADETAAREAAQLAFFEESIREAVTLDEGLVVDRGKAVTDGAGLIGVFHARKDVLSAFLVAIYTQNRLSGVLRKNLNSPHGSASGSAASTLASPGDAPVSTAASVGGRGSASGGAATDASDPAADGGTLKVH
jgi:hypothetical protein